MLDEYERLEELPGARQAGLLRALFERPWLATGFVGLHHPDELAPALRDALAGCPAIPVGRLDPAAFAALLAGDAVGPWHFAPDGIGRAFALTGGQPFLGRLLGEMLAREDGRRTRDAPAFIAAEVEAAAAAERFSLGARPYFDGHWARAAESPPGQRTLLQALAPHETGLDREAWRQADRPARPIAALYHHHVLAPTPLPCRPTSRGKLSYGALASKEAISARGTASTQTGPAC